MRISIILPVLNETYSLRETVEIIHGENPECNFEYVIATHPKRTQEESRKVIGELCKKYTVVHVEQDRPFIGGALCKAIEHSKGDYTILMASDLETDPHTVKDLIKKMKEGFDIVATSRWIGKGSFKGYDPAKLLFNKIFQWFFGILYRTSLTDLTFAYRLYATPILKAFDWEEQKHPVLFELILKPLRMRRYKITEIPSSWSARTEGESQNTFMQNFNYFKVGFRLLFKSKKDLLKKATH